MHYQTYQWEVLCYAEFAMILFSKPSMHEGNNALVQRASMVIHMATCIIGPSGLVRWRGERDRLSMRAQYLVSFQELFLALKGVVHKPYLKQKGEHHSQR
jgi:hypothetical protein